ncbi:hypothetical protein JOB18_019066 [Solea senegalensis]|uniref:Uncharacterized protein n=1 Tax=Solea senegalensis TaxID=28829 RepID=A0AAV6Q8Z1_SOLSE|nr:hypothetical protein JOB18_019066 [Solea senegalensis]
MCISSFVYVNLEILFTLHKASSTALLGESTVQLPPAPFPSDETGGNDTYMVVTHCYMLMQKELTLREGPGVEKTNCGLYKGRQRELMSRPSPPQTA